MNSRLHKSNFVNEETNPCIEESNLSIKCLEQNGYDQEKCVLHFKNYQVCKKFWSKVAEERKKNGIKPYMPGSVERKKIAKEFNETNEFVYTAV